MLAAAREGFAIDWTRLCDEVALTREVFLNIEAAITKAGSRDKLKPIKIESPEYVSFILQQFSLFLVPVICI